MPFTFGAPTGNTPAATTAASSFSFGTPAGSAPVSTAAAGFSFGAPATTTSNLAGFSFGSGPTTAAPGAAAPTLSLGASAAPATGFSFGASPATSLPSGGGLSFAPPSTASSTTTSLTFNMPVAQTTTTAAPAASVTFNLPKPTLPPSTTPTAGGIAAAAAVTATTTGGGMFGSVTTPAFSLQQQTKPQQLSFGLTSSAPSTAGTGAASALSAPVTTSATVSTTAPASLGTNTVVTGSSQTTTGGASNMTFRGLEEFINKCTVDLEEHERLLLKQATQVNAWDRQLIKNAQKITELHSATERLRVDQERLDTELGFIASLHTELEDILTPLEKSVQQSSTGGVLQQHADIERERTYTMSESVHVQLMSLSDDLADMIDHINAANKCADQTNPMVQISRILNAHMDSLQWVEESTSLLQKQLAEASAQLQQRRQQQTNTLRLTLD